MNHAIDLKGRCRLVFRETADGPQAGGSGAGSAAPAWGSSSSTSARCAASAVSNM